MSQKYETPGSFNKCFCSAEHKFCCVTASECKFYAQEKKVFTFKHNFQGAKETGSMDNFISMLSRANSEKFQHALVVKRKFFI